MTDCFCDFEYPQFYRSETRAARIAHKCDECRKPIPPGEKYEYVSAKSDGEFWSAHTCSRCLALREYVKEHVPCFCWAHSSMLENAKETIEEYAHQCPGLFMGYGRLRVAIRKWTCPPT